MRQKPKEGTRFLRIRMPDQWLDTLADLASDENISLTAYVQTIISTHLTQESNDVKPTTRNR